MIETVYNFSAGPAMLPKEVLEKVQKELLNFNNSGSSVMEISHRSASFLNLVEEAEENLRRLLNIPDYYHVLYAQGGARAQFAAVPLNLLGNNEVADYINSGYWSKCAIKEATKYCQPNEINVLEDKKGQTGVRNVADWPLNENAAYVHICPNETITGIRINELPETKRPIVADMSSCILSQPIDIKKYAVIYAGAQKNIGPAGLTLVIVRDDLLGLANEMLPNVLNYKTLAKTDSMYNTPPTFSWYLAGEVYKWLIAQGGLEAMQERNEIKAALLYDCIDRSEFYQNTVLGENRSFMNVSFHLTNPALDKAFLKQAENHGLKALKGHRDVGGMRASMYNAMPLEGIEALVSFMEKFEKENASS